MQSYDPKDKETEHENENLIDEQRGDISDSTTPLAIVKNKKRVHYPHLNGEQPVLNIEKTDNLTTSADLYSKSVTGSFEKPISGDHVIPIENERCCGCCSTSRPFRPRLNKALTPWREFFEYQSGWSWVILVAAFLTYSIGEALTSVFPILFVALQNEFPNQGSSRIALVQSMMNAVPCLAGPIASITTTRFGYRKTAMLGGGITSLSLLATSFARRLEILYITMGVCYAIGNSLVLVSTVVAVTEHFDAKPSFASGVTISGGAFGQCVFAIVLQKLIDKYDWNGAMMFFSGIVLFIVAFGALFREVEWDEEDYDEEEEGEEEETENGTETISTAIAPSEQSELLVETTHTVVPNEEPERTMIHATSNTPPPTHKPSITDDLVFFDQFTKQELLDQYSKSEICLPLAIREHLENEHRQHRLEQEERDFTEQKLSSSTTQIEQTDEIHRAAEVPPIVERSNSCKDLPLLEATPLTTEKSTPSNNPPSATNNPRKTRPHRRTRRVSTNTPHENKPYMFHYPLHHQQRNLPTVTTSGSTRTHHHHHHHHHPLHINRGNLSQLALCSKNIYNYESVLNICKLQSLHFSIDRSLSLPNLYTPIKRHRSLTVTGDIDDYLEDEDEDEDEIRKKNFFEQFYRDICKLFRVLRILPFLLLCVCVTMITIFYDATWTFLVDYMNKNNLTSEKGAHLILGVGIVSIFGEIGYGYMGDSKR
jgi:predicted MFS family arabinose efflux permease